MKKYGIIITAEGEGYRVSDIPNYREFFVMDSYKIRSGSREEDVGKLCIKINRDIEKILAAGIKTKIEIMVDNRLEEYTKVLENKLGYITRVELGGE